MSGVNPEPEPTGEATPEPNVTVVNVEEKPAWALTEKQWQEWRQQQNEIAARLEKLMDRIPEPPPVEPPAAEPPPVEPAPTLTVIEPPPNPDVQPETSKRQPKNRKRKIKFR